jgi:uncharacterized protein YfaS (alpha-2-macroglobulin family)
MNYYRARPHLLTLDTRALLAGAYALSGQWSTYHSTIPRSFIPDRPLRQSGGSFDSELRSNAVLANVLLEVDPSNDLLPSVLRYLGARVGDLYSTQELAFAMLALGKAARRSAETDLNVTVSANGKVIAKSHNRDIVLTDADLPDSDIEIRADGPGGAMTWLWSEEGVRAKGVPDAIDSQLRVRRTWIDHRTGRAIPPDRLKQGQLVACRITLEGRGRSVDNIVVTDVIPAGCEIENPRLGLTAGPRLKPAHPLVPEYMDVRDDRLLLYTAIGGSDTRDFIYLLRVVNRGSFLQPPITAEAMYDPSYRSVHGGGTVRVEAR